MTTSLKPDGSFTEDVVRTNEAVRVRHPASKGVKHLSPELNTRNTHIVDVKCRTRIQKKLLSFSITIISLKMCVFSGYGNLKMWSVSNYQVIRTCPARVRLIHLKDHFGKETVTVFEWHIPERLS